MSILHIAQPAKFAGRIIFGRYVETGGLSISIVDSATGGPVATATTNVESYGAPKPAADEVWLKGWSENEGLPEALAATGVLRLTGEVTAAGYTKAVKGKLTPATLRIAIDEAGPAS